MLRDPVRRRRVCLTLGLVACLGARAADPGQELLLHLPFDGTTEAAVGGDLGAPTVQGTPTFTEGRHGQGVSLTDGTHLVLSLPPAIREGEFTIAFWMKPLWHPQDGLPHPILEVAAKPESYDDVGWSAGQFLISKGWSDTISPDHFYGVVDPGAAALHLKPGVWVHLAVSFSVSGGFRAAYVNGEGMRRPEKDLKPLDAHRNVVWLGSRAKGQGSADVVLDDFRIYGYAAGQDDIPGIAGAELPPPRDFLLLGSVCDPSKAVETPHTPWGKPYAGGRLRVLFVGEGVRSRDFIELAQRLDIEPLAVTGPPIQGFTLKNSETFEAMGERVVEHLGAGGIDCLIVGSFGWNLFAESARNAVMDYVRNGGGLLFSAPRCTGEPGNGRWTNAGGGLWLGWAETPEGKAIEALVARLERIDQEYLTATIPWTSNTHFATQMERLAPWQLFRGGEVGKGRILIYDVHTDSTYGCVSLSPALCWMGSFDLFDYDYTIGAVAKAVLWAAGRDSPVRIQSITYGSDRQFFRKVPVGLNGRWRVRVLNLDDAPRPVRVQLRARTRVRAAPFAASREVTLPPGLSHVDLPHLMDRTGEVFADVSLLEDGKTADWATTAVRAVHGNPWFIELRPDRRAYTSGERPRMTAAVALKTYGKSPGESGELHWRLLDCHGRLVARGEEPVRFNPYDQMPATLSWLVPELDASSLCYELVVDLSRNGRVTDQRVLALRHRTAGVDDFTFYAWGGSGSPPDCLGALVMRDRYGLEGIGVNFGDALSSGPASMTDLAKGALEWAGSINMRPWIYATHLGGGFDGEKMRSHDLADPRFRAGMQARLRAVAEISKPYDPLFYGLGDEVQQGPPNARTSGHEESAFRSYLKERYRKIDGLNEAWETEYGTWRDVEVPSTGEGIDMGNNPRRVAELRAFRDTLFADLAAAGVEAICSVDPGAYVGIEGIFGLTHHWGNFDYSKLSPAVTFMGQYALGMEMDMVRSFQKPGNLLGCWYNYRKLDREYSLLGPWHVLLRGCRAFGWYTISEGSHYTALNPDFTPFEQFAWTWEELEPILGGLGKLVVGLARDDPGVSVLYEHKNLDRHSPSFLSMMTMTTLLTDIGLQHDFISSLQVEQGGLAARRVRALILPRPFVMRAGVAETVKAFVQNGGLVVADEAVAVSDGYRRYEERPLDSLFSEHAGLKGGTFPRTAADAEAWSSHEKTVGGGATLYFGQVAKAYRRERLREPGGFMRLVVSGFLARHGIAPSFSVRAASKPFLPVDVVCYRDGASRYLGMQRGYKIVDQSPQSFEVRGPGGAHVYDVRAGTYLGQGDRVTVELEVARGALLAFLPYKARQVRIDGLPDSVRPGEVVPLLLTLEAEGGAPAGGVFRVEARDPSSKRVPALCVKPRSTGGVARTQLRIAHNDPHGSWTLAVTDIATGVRSEAEFRVGE